MDKSFDNVVVLKVDILLQDYYIYSLFSLGALREHGSRLSAFNDESIVGEQVNELMFKDRCKEFS